MADAGFLPINRKMFDGDDLLWEGDEPFDRRSAWIDLCQMAKHRACSVIIKGEVVNLERGQLVGSERFLAKRWGWTRAKVRRFMDLLASEKVQRISIDAAHDLNQCGTIVTLLNYTTYNGQVRADRPTFSTTAQPAPYQIEERKELTTPPPTTDAGERATALPADTDIARLRLYLGEHAPAVEMMLQSAEHPPNWISAVLGKFGPTGTQAQVWTGIPSERRPAVIATVLMEYATGGKQFENRHFDGYMRKATNNERNGNQSGGPRIEAQSPPLRLTGTDGGRRRGFIIEGQY